MERDPIQTTDAERGERPLVLQAPELALDSSAALVELPPPGRLARHERVEAVGGYPPARGRALARGAAPLRPATLRRVGLKARGAPCRSPRSVAPEVASTPP